MVTLVKTAPLVVHEVTRWPFCRHQDDGRFEVRPVRYRMAAALLGITVADLDCVRDAHSFADHEHCLVCGPGGGRKV